MIHIIPAAGPDFIIREHKVKLAEDFKGSAIIDQTLLSRSWRQKNDKYIFVFQDHKISRKYCVELRSKFDSVEFIFLSAFSNGAADTVLAGLSIAGPQTPICIDLADIIIHDKIKRTDILTRLNSYDAMALTFTSRDDKYSYLKFNNNEFKLAKEKEVISDNASAGVYFFQDKRTLLSAVSRILDKKEFMVGEMNYVCPLFNGCNTVANIMLDQIIDVKNA